LLLLTWVLFALFTLFTLGIVPGIVLGIVPGGGDNEGKIRAGIFDILLRISLTVV
jgi:hypothetical protein